MRLQPKFGLRFLFIAVALIPLLIWGVYQYQVRKQRVAARQRLQQIADTPSGNDHIRTHWSFHEDAALVDLIFRQQPDPYQLLSDCRQAGTQIHQIIVTNECLVDVTLARRIADVPDLARLDIASKAQIEPEALPILLGSAPEVCLDFLRFQSIIKIEPRFSAPQRLVIDALPEDSSQFMDCVHSAVNWGPKVLVLSYYIDADQAADWASGAAVRAEFHQLQLANPQMLISHSGLAKLHRDQLNSGDGTAPTYTWRTSELKALFESDRVDITFEDRAKRLEQVWAAEPNAWPPLQNEVRQDFYLGNFSIEAETRAQKLVELAPWYPEGHLNLGMAHYLRGEYEQAIEPLQRGVLRAHLGFGNRSDMYFFGNRGAAFLAAAHVPLGRRTEALRVLERQMVSPVVYGRRRSEILAADIVAGVWIQCTASDAGQDVAKRCEQQLEIAVESLGSEHQSQIQLTRAALFCLQKDYAKAREEYDAINQKLSVHVKPRFRAEFQKLGDAIKHRRQFVTDYVPVVPMWD